MMCVSRSVSVYKLFERLSYLLQVWHSVDKSIADNTTGECQSFFEYVYGQMVNTSSNGSDNINIHSAM